MARWMFQQLIVGLDYLHRMVCDVEFRGVLAAAAAYIPPSLHTPHQHPHPATTHPLPTQNICSRDIKLENTLVKGNPANPVLKICDFGYSKSSDEQSQAQTTVGTIGMACVTRHCCARHCAAFLVAFVLRICCEVHVYVVNVAHTLYATTRISCTSYVSSYASSTFVCIALQHSLHGARGCNRGTGVRRHGCRHLVRV